MGVRELRRIPPKAPDLRGVLHGKIWIDDETSAARLNISAKPMM